MYKILIAVALIIVLTTSIYSQADARFGGFRGFSGGGGSSFGGGLGKLFSSHSVPMGTGQGKTFTSSPSGKINSPQEIDQHHHLNLQSLLRLLVMVIILNLDFNFNKTLHFKISLILTF